MSIPFIRGFPDGTTGLQEVSRSEEIEERAHRFIAYGGQFLAQIAPDAQVNLIAIFPENGGEMKAVAQETCGNGFELLPTVDRLVRRAVLSVPAKMPPKLLVPRHLAS